MIISTETVFPKTFCVDKGTNFRAELSKAFTEILGISPKCETPEHPESIGDI